MPRDGSGVYSVPAGTTATPNTTILSANYNAFVADLETDANAARPVSAGGTGGTSVITGWDGLAKKGTDIVSASSINLTTATGPSVTITGTATISTVTLAEGSFRLVRAGGAFTWEAGASLLVNGSTTVDVTAAANDLFLVRGGASSVVSVVGLGSASIDFSSNADAVAGTKTDEAINAANLSAVRQLLSGVPFNLGLAASVGSNALTISLKGADGNDPSATNPVEIPFRNVTVTTGTPTVLSVTAATSVVVSSGSTLGTANGVATTLVVVGFNDGGTFRLGVINPLALPIKDGIASSTAEGGAGAADSAGVYYTGTAVTSKALTVLGWLTISEATAGTWATAHTAIGVGNAPVTAMQSQAGQLMAWVNFNGTGTVAINGSSNVSSITDHGAGNYTVNFTTAMADVNYSVGGAAMRGTAAATGTGAFVKIFPNASSFSTGSIRIATDDGAGAIVDCEYICVQIFR